MCVVPYIHVLELVRPVLLHFRIQCIFLQKIIRRVCTFFFFFENSRKAQVRHLSEIIHSCAPPQPFSEGIYGKVSSTIVRPMSVSLAGHTVILNPQDFRDGWGCSRYMVRPIVHHPPFELLAFIFILATNQS